MNITISCNGWPAASLPATAELGVLLEKGKLHTPLLILEITSAKKFNTSGSFPLCSRFEPGFFMLASCVDVAVFHM